MRRYINDARCCTIAAAVCVCARARVCVCHFSALLWGGSVTQQDISRLNTFQASSLQDIVTLLNMWCNVDILEETGELPIKESS